MMAEITGPPPWARGRPIAIARPSPDPTAAHRQRLRKALKAHRDADQRAETAWEHLRDTVREAHEAGLSYNQIGATLGTAPMTVHAYANGSWRNRVRKQRGGDPTSKRAKAAAAKMKAARDRRDHDE